eukprot:g27441.t1
MDRIQKRDECFMAQCKGNKLSLNISKMKELVIDFRKQGGGHAPIYVNVAEVEMVDSIKFLGVTITNNLSWSTHVDEMVKKAQQHLYFYGRLRKFGIGVAMGTRIGPSYACLFVGYVEHSLFQSYSSPNPQIFLRYINDII